MFDLDPHFAQVLAAIGGFVTGAVIATIFWLIVDDLKNRREVEAYIEPHGDVPHIDNAWSGR